MHNKNYTNVILEGLDMEQPSSFYPIISAYSKRYLFDELKIVNIKSTDANCVELTLTLNIPLTGRDYEEYMDLVMYDLLNAMYCALDISYKYNTYQHVYKIEPIYRNIAIEPIMEYQECVTFLVDGTLSKYHTDALRYIFGYTDSEIGSMLLSFEIANGLDAIGLYTDYDEDDDDFVTDLGLYESGKDELLPFDVTRAIPEDKKELIKDKLNQLGIKYEFRNYVE